MSKAFKIKSDLYRLLYLCYVYDYVQEGRVPPTVLLLFDCVQDGQVVCLKCGDFLENAEALERHTLNHKLKAKYNCERCDEFFARRQQYAKHVETHDKYSCEYCGNNFSSRKRLVTHQTKSCDQKAEELPAVPTDSIQLPNPVSFSDAEPKGAASAQPELPKEKEYIKIKGKYQCRLCVYTHVKASKVVRHARCHATMRKFVCETCGVAFKAMNTLKDHLLYRHNDEKKFQCTRCPKAFKVHGNLLRHAQVRMRFHWYSRLVGGKCTQFFCISDFTLCPLKSDPN